MIKVIRVKHAILFAPLVLVLLNACVKKKHTELADVNTVYSYGEMNKSDGYIYSDTTVPVNTSFKFGVSLDSLEPGDYFTSFVVQRHINSKEPVNMVKEYFELKTGALYKEILLTTGTTPQQERYNISMGTKNGKGFHRRLQVKVQ